MEVITYEIQQQVKVRKYNVDCQKLCDLLRKHKKMASLSNKEIAKTLNMPITKVEHWFRQDSCFSIPDECIWFELKKLLKITDNEFDLAITTFEEKDNVFEKGNRIYDSQGICPTITCLDGLVVLDRSDEMETVRLGGLWDGATKHQAGSVWDKNLIAPTIDTMQGGGREPMIIDDTYANRQPRVYEDYSPALRSEREGLKTIETISTKGKQIEVASTILAGYERTNMTGFNADNGVAEVGTEIINPLKGISDNGWHFEQNVYDENGLIRSIKSESGSGNIPKVITRYRIRKLTPKECWRLMDFTDEDFEKAAQVNSNTQLYRQAGNSIPKNLLVAIFGQMLPGKENIYKEN